MIAQNPLGDQHAHQFITEIRHAEIRPHLYHDLQPESAERQFRHIRGNRWPRRGDIRRCFHRNDDGNFKVLVVMQELRKLGGCILASLGNVVARLQIRPVDHELSDLTGRARI